MIHRGSLFYLFSQNEHFKSQAFDSVVCKLAAVIINDIIPFFLIATVSFVILSECEESYVADYKTNKYI